MKTWLIRISVVLMVVCLASLPIWQEETPEPDRCSLCDYITCHAPCIVNLTTGQTGELALYQPHDTLVGEISETSCNSIFAFVYPAGCKGTMTTYPWKMEVDMPVGHQKMDKGYFCNTCRELLKPYCRDGYVLMDNHDKADIKIYPIYDGAEYEIRCYKISVSKDPDEKNMLNLLEVGTLVIPYTD